MKKKIVGILVCILVIAAVVLPVGGITKNNETERLGLKNSLFSQPPTQWTKIFGGPGWDDAGFSVQQTSEGGYIACGFSMYWGTGYNSAWLLKTDANGNEQWNNTYGSIGEQQGHSVQQTTDGGYILVGFTDSGAGEDVWLVKTNANGIEMWNKSFGGTLQDIGFCVCQTSDGGYIISGATSSFGGGSADAWLIKTNSNGVELWNRTFTNVDNEVGWSVRQTTDGGYIIAGRAHV